MDTLSSITNLATQIIVLYLDYESFNRLKQVNKKFNTFEYIIMKLYNQMAQKIQAFVFKTYLCKTHLICESIIERDYTGEWQIYPHPVIDMYRKRYYCECKQRIDNIFNCRIYLTNYFIDVGDETECTIVCNNCHIRYEYDYIRTIANLYIRTIYR
jgi:hypothetical protein